MNNTNNTIINSSIQKMSFKNHDSTTRLTGGNEDIMDLQDNCIISEDMF